MTYTVTLSCSWRVLDTVLIEVEADSPDAAEVIAVDSLRSDKAGLNDFDISEVEVGRSPASQGRAAAAEAVEPVSAVSSTASIPNAAPFHKGQLVRDIRDGNYGRVEQPRNGFLNVTIRLEDGWLRSVAPEHLEAAQ
jgi:hypothetical protein